MRNNYLSEQAIEVLEQSKNLLDTPENWDEEGALPVKYELYTSAYDFIHRLAKLIYDKHHVKFFISDIDNVQDGSVDLYWSIPYLASSHKDENARVLANINYNKRGFVVCNLFGCYIDRLNKDKVEYYNTIKINDMLLELIENSFIDWMAKFLKKIN